MWNVGLVWIAEPTSGGGDYLVTTDTSFVLAVHQKTSLGRALTSLASESNILPQFARAAGVGHKANGSRSQNTDRSPPGTCAKLLVMFVRHYGNSGPLVLVLHGGPAAVGDVAPVAKGISGSFQAVEPWQRGSGGEPLTVDRHVTDLHELATDLGGDSPVAILGHSWGAMLALCYAARYPDKAGPIALVGCGTFDQASRSRMQETIEERMDDDLRDRIRRVSTDTTDPADQFMQTFNLTRHVFDCDPINPYADKEECEPFDLKAHDETWSDMRRLQDNGTYPDAFTVIESPVLMLHGQYDPHPGQMIRDSLLPYLPQLEFHEFERCGHSPWIEKSTHEQFFSGVCEWLERQTS